MKSLYAVVCVVSILFSCIDSESQEECSSNADCPPVKDISACTSSDPKIVCVAACENGSCINKAVPIGCRNKDDCYKGQICADSKCVKETASIKSKLIERARPGFRALGKESKSDGAESKNSRNKKKRKVLGNSVRTVKIVDIRD